MREFLNELKARGFIQDATPGLAERLAKGPITAYIGFDPTADSLHVGNLVPVMGLAWLQRSGGTPIPLLGGGTGMVGDPSGKRDERPILPVGEIDANVERIRAQLERFLQFDGPNAARVRNNADWLRGLGLMEFLRDSGKHFTLSYMLQKESVKSRMETGISFTEFSYMLVQAHDFWHLFKQEGCELQMGGSDQWGNITAGRELVARREGKEVHGLVFPLLTTTSGAKFGKSEAGNVWLDPKRTSVYDFYQYWINTDDRDVERFLKMFTFLPLPEIRTIMEAHQKNPSKRVAQELLASEVTKLAHNDIQASQARDQSLVLFASGASIIPITSAGTGTVQEAGSESPGLYHSLAGAIPTQEYSRVKLKEGVSLIDALIATGLASSKGDARRYLKQSAFSVNRVKTNDVDRTLTDADVKEGKYILLQKGKKSYAMVVVEGSQPSAEEMQ